MDRIQKIGVTAFIHNNDKVLIVKRSKNDDFLAGYWELPGGKVDFGESPEIALEREIKEETNLDIKIIKPYSTFSYTNKDNNKHTIDIQYICNIISDINDLGLSEEHEECKFINKNEINNYQMSNEMKKVVVKGFEIFNS